MRDVRNTGRLNTLIPRELRDLVFGRIDQFTIENELQHFSHIDLAHVYMLMRQDIVPTHVAKRLLRQISVLREEQFKNLVGISANRGAYLEYENALIESLGIDIGGVLQSGRSRNDLNATVLKLRLRDFYRDVMNQAIVVLDSCITRVVEETDVPFPAYTHYQTAFPTSFSHYLLSISSQLLRDVEQLHAAFDEIHSCPLGAGAGGGTTLKIDPELTAKLLGFTKTVSFSIDAVASRDLVTRILSAASFISVTISRLCADVMIWSTNEFDVIRLPDELVGSSSNMPQKKNPFLLEHLKGLCASVVANNTAALGSMHWTPFSNSVAVGTEAVKQLWQGCDNLMKILKITKYLVQGVKINIRRVYELLEKGHTDAFILSEKLVARGEYSFRHAHHIIGQLVNIAENTNVPLRKVFMDKYERGQTEQSREDYFDDLIARIDSGFGANATEREKNIQNMVQQIKRLQVTVSTTSQNWKDANKNLEKLIYECC